MKKADALARLQAKLLTAYSARTVAALRTALPLRVALPHVEPVLEANLEKEIRKDTLVIHDAAAAVAVGRPPDLESARRLFAATRQIDEAFLRRVEAFPVRVVIRYEEIEPVRMRRIQRLGSAAYRILAAWGDRTRLRAALCGAYSPTEFEWLLAELSDLYARETRALSRSLRMPALLAPLRERVAQHLLDTMTQTGLVLARSIARGVYCRSAGSLHALGGAQPFDSRQAFH